MLAANISYCKELETLELYYYTLPLERSGAETFFISVRSLRKITSLIETWTVSRFMVSALTCFINLYIIYTVQAKEIFYKTRKSLIVKTTTRDSYNSLEDFWFIPPEEYRT